jgi:HAD superfamily hydrolase (TIGR01484 family)
MPTLALIAIDLDGTLLNQANVVTPRSKAALQAAQRRGVRIVLATTRNLYFVRELCNELGLVDPIICSNGAQILAAPSGETWAYLTIPTDVALAIAQLADEQGWAMSSTIGEMKYVRQRPQQALGPITANVTVVPTNVAGVVGPPLRILFWHPAAIACFSELCRVQWRTACHTETYYSAAGEVESFGIFPTGADKGSALALVLGKLDLTPEAVLAIGDNDNDIPLLAQAGIKVAMGNGTAALKKDANVIAPDNEHDGVAWAIEQFVL